MIDLIAAISLVLEDASGWGHMGGWGWGMAIMGGLFMTSVVILAGWLVWSISRRPLGGSNLPRNLLDERYALGEIERDEYLERSADLER